MMKVQTLWRRNKI